MTHDPDLSIALKTLPPTLFRDTVARLTGGQTVRRVARWLMTQNRGELQHQGLYEIRKQVAQLKARIDRNEDVSVDPPPEPQAGQTQAVPSAYEVRLQKLQEMAMADSLTGREVLNFVLCTELELLRELQQNGGSPGQQSTVLKHVRHVGEYLCKLGPGLNAWCEEYPMLGPDGDPVDCSQQGNDRKQLDAETMKLIREVKEMDPADRMLGLSLLGMAEEVVKLEVELELERRQQEEQPPAPAPPEGEPQP
jgi:hypothetical protein